MEYRSNDIIGTCQRNAITCIEKGVKRMRETFKQRVLKCMASLSLKVGKKEAGAICRCIYHQPKVPEELLGKSEKTVG